MVSLIKKLECFLFLHSLILSLSLSLTIPPSKLLILLLHLRSFLLASALSGLSLLMPIVLLLPGLSFASPYILLYSLFVSPFHSVFVFQSISTDS